MDFSVLLSVYRKEKPQYLRQSLDSVLHQTVPPTEIVMVEDGPLTPELYAVLDEYKKDPRWKAVPLPQNVGLGKALNAGLQACSFELVARMDTDDIARPERFEKQLAAFEADPDLALCGTQVCEFRDKPEAGVSRKRVPLEDEDIRRYARRRNPFNHPTVMYKKSAVLRAGSYQHAMWFEDYYLWARMLAQGSKAKNLPEELLWFRAGDDMFGRRGGWKYVKSAVAVKYKLWRLGVSGFGDFLVSAGGQAVVGLMPNGLRRRFYEKFLRKDGEADGE